MSMEQEVQEALSSLMKHIRKEIQKGQIDSHISFEQNGDQFSLITKLKGKPPTRQTWEIPQEDRDEHISLLKELETLKKDKPFVKLLQAIKSTRKIMYSDEVWKKNIIDFLGESVDLDTFVNMKKKETAGLDALLEDVHMAKKIQNTMTEKTEKNIILQSLYQALILKEFSETRDVKQYHAFSSLLQPKKLVHEIRKTDSSVSYVIDGEPYEGEIVKTYSSLKQFETHTLKQQSKEIANKIGAVGDLRQLLQRFDSFGLKSTIHPQLIAPGTTHFIISNQYHQLSLGSAPFEAYIEGSQAMGGNNVRVALNYLDETYPAVFNGQLYRHRLMAIMTPFIPADKDPNMSDLELWKLYNETFNNSATRRNLQKQELLVLTQNWIIHSQQFKYLKSVWSQGVHPLAIHLINKELYASNGRIQKLLIDKAALTSDWTEQNQTVMLNWILNNTDWQKKTKQMSRNIDMSPSNLKRVIELTFNINISKASEEGLERFIELWKQYQPVEWSTQSLEESIVRSKMNAHRVSETELVTYIREYGEALWTSLKRLDKFKQVPDEYGMAVVLGVFLSIIHSSLDKATESNIILVSARDTTKTLFVFSVGLPERDIIRGGMETVGISGFELPLKGDETGEAGGGGGAGALEGKVEEDEETDEEKIQSMEEDRIIVAGKDIPKMKIAVDRGMSMRLLL